MVHDVVGGAADEEGERPGPGRLAVGVEGADGVEVPAVVDGETFGGGPRRAGSSPASK
jgi:hypothetical protein